MRMRRKKNLLLRMERAASVLIRDPEALKGIWQAAFPACRAVHLELGCGKGGFTLETAKQMPETLLLAVERYKDALITAMERAIKEEARNIRFLNVDASSLGAVFAACEVQRIYINFCDPWPGKRHEKRRLTSPQFIKLYRTFLAPEGEIHFKTDNKELFAYSARQLEEGGFQLSHVTENLHDNGICGVMTDYERKFHGEGKPIFRLEARKKTADGLHKKIKEAAV